MSCVQGLAQTAQKWLVKSHPKWSIRKKSVSPLRVGFAHAWPVLEYISGDGWAFLGKTWWSLSLPRASGHAETQADALGEWLAILITNLGSRFSHPCIAAEQSPFNRHIWLCYFMSYTYHKAVISAPSYSLDIIYSNVAWTDIALQDDQEDLQRSTCSHSNSKPNCR